MFVEEKEIIEAEVNNEEAPKEETLENAPVEEKTPYQNIEDQRLEFQHRLAKAKKRSKVFMGVVMLCLVGVIVGMSINQSIILWISAGVALAVSIISFIINRRYERPDLNSYLFNYLNYCSEIYFKNSDFEDVNYERNIKLEINEVLLDALYKDVAGIHSRNFNYGKYHDHTFNVCECDILARPTGSKRHNVMFLGKRIYMLNSLHLDQKYVIVLKGKEDTDLPDNLEGLHVLEEKDNMIVYGTEGADHKQDLNKEFFKLINKINHSGHILNVNLVISASRSIAYLSYDQEAVDFPIDKPVNEELIKNCKKDVLNALAALESLEK